MLEVYAINIRKDKNSNIFNDLLKLVNYEKREKIKSYYFLDDAVRSLYGEVLIRYVICRKLGIRNNELKFVKNNFGKPLLDNSKDIHFNISHSGNWVVGVIDIKPVGIDIEKLQQIDYSSFKDIFSQYEYRELMNKSIDERKSYFYTLWTLKESYIKAIGMGMSMPLSSFSFSIKNNKIFLINENEGSSFHFWSNKIDNSHIFSICSQNEDENTSIMLIEAEALQYFAHWQ